MSVFVPSPLRPPPLSTKYRRRRRPPASHAINIVFHVKHTRRTRHTRPAQPSASMLPHFAQLHLALHPSTQPPRLPANPARARRHCRPSTLAQHPALPAPDPQHPSAAGLQTIAPKHPTAAPPSAPPPAPRPQHPAPSTSPPAPRPHNPKHPSTYALSSFPALDATNVAELELRAPGYNQPTSAYERNHRD